MRFDLKPLPFALDALAPRISKETLELHWGKHHRAYVDKLNTLVAGTEFDKMALPDIVRKTNGPLFNNAAQAWNHDFYWGSLSPRATLRSDELAAAIDASFGSFGALEKKFKAEALAKFGSGWTWLVLQAGKLAVRNSDDADCPLLWGETALLCCDVWEHAYYIDYRNERAKYIDAFWELANWDFASGNLARVAKEDVLVTVH
jgi:Fe-Mn family superoxide dismutase